MSAGSILPQSSNYSQTQIYGAQGEAYALGQLTRLGYKAQPLTDWTDQGDLLITAPVPVPVLVEVKISQPRQTWQKRSYGWQERTFYSWEVDRIRRDVDAVVILVADTPDGYRSFVVPSWLTWQRSVIHIASDPEAYAGRGRGWLSDFYESWQDTIDQVSAVRQRFSRTGQLSFWGTVV